MTSAATIKAHIGKLQEQKHHAHRVCDMRVRIANDEIAIYEEKLIATDVKRLAKAVAAYNRKKGTK